METDGPTCKTTYEEMAKEVGDDTIDPAIQQIADERHEFYESRDMNPVQPYLILCGPCYAITSSYVVMDKIIYKCESPLYAADLCFKLFFSLNIDYPNGCPHVWSFFQKCIYNIKGKNVTALGKILQLNTDLNKL